MAGSGSFPFLELRILGKCGCLGSGSSACEQVTTGAVVSPPCPSVTSPSVVPQLHAPRVFLQVLTALHLFTAQRLPLFYPLLYYAVSGIEPRP